MKALVSMASTGQFAFSAITVATLRPGAEDDAGHTVETIYARSIPNYVVYKSSDRVSVHFADNPEIAKAQRAQLAALTPLRGEIAGLLDSWRPARSMPGPSTRQAVWWLWKGRRRGRDLDRKLVRYDRRVADALALALEGSVADAAKLLESVRTDIGEERAQAARVRVLGFAMVLALAIMGTAAWVSSYAWRADRSVDAYLLAASSAAVGAFFSIAARARLLADMDVVANLFGCSLRIATGIAAALVVHTALESGIVTLGFGKVMVAGGDIKPSWQVVVVMGFLAGFAERFVPDLLARASAGAAESPVFLASASAAALEDMRKMFDVSVREALVGPEIGATVREAIIGPELVRFDGYVSAKVEWDEGRIDRVNVVLRFSPANMEGASRVLISRGVSQPTVDFLIECEPSASPSDQVATLVTVPTTRDHVAPPISVAVPKETDSLWIALRQGGRLIQTIEVALVSDRESE